MVPAWLNNNAPGYENLTGEEKNAVMHFSLLWSLFEAQVLNTSASANSIEHKMAQWNNGGLINLDDFSEYKNYFVQRYIENGATNYRFDHLHLRQGDKLDLVRGVLDGSITDASSIVTALFIIVLRYRNNFFHGIKWAYEFKEQLSNFNTANSLLMKALELNQLKNNITS